MNQGWWNRSRVERDLFMIKLADGVDGRRQAV